MYYPYSTTSYGTGAAYPTTAYPGTQTAQPVPISYVPAIPSGGPIQPGITDTPQGINVPGLLPAEESYIENILRLNLGKVATIYMTFENNEQWNAKVFKGVLEAAGRDHIIISDPRTGQRFLLLMLNLDYITFDEELNYDLPFGTQQAAVAAP